MLQMVSGLVFGFPLHQVPTSRILNVAYFLGALNHQMRLTASLCQSFPRAFPIVTRVRGKWQDEWAKSKSDKLIKSHKMKSEQITIAVTRTRSAVENDRTPCLE